MITLDHLETNVTIACTRRCTHCNHFVPLQEDRVKASMITPEALAQDLHHFSRVAHAKAYAMIGGEPTLHPQLITLMQIARDMNVADEIEVWTNGEPISGWSFRKQTAFFSAEFDTLVLSAYPGVMTDNKIAHIRSLCNSYGKTFHLKDERAHPNFTQLLVPEGEAGEDAPTQLRYDRCWFKTYSRVLDHGYFYRCCTSPFIAQLLQGRPVGADGLKVDADLTEEALRSFLARGEFMEGCRRCAGRNTAEAVPVTWGEERKPLEWIKRSEGR